MTLEATLKQARQVPWESIENELKRAVQANDQYLYVVEVDDLIAAWCHGRKKFARSTDPARVPTEYRYSAPPFLSSRTKPCHVSFMTKPAHRPVAGALGTAISCIGGRHPGIPTSVPAINELEAADFAKRNVAPYISPFVDSITLARLTKDLGIPGKAVTKEINGRQYVVFSGYAGLRTIFRGTRYSLDHHRIVQMGIGKLGIKNIVKSGARLTIFITVPLTILECILKDEVIMSELLGKVTADLLKICISALIVGIIGLGVVGSTSAVSMPLFAVILVSVIVGGSVEIADSNFKLPEKLTRLIKNELSRKRIDVPLSKRPHNSTSSVYCHSSR